MTPIFSDCNPPLRSALATNKALQLTLYSTFQSVCRGPDDTSCPLGQFCKLDASLFDAAETLGVCASPSQSLSSASSISDDLPIPYRRLTILGGGISPPASSNTASTHFIRQPTNIPSRPAVPGNEPNGRKGTVVQERGKSHKVRNCAMRARGITSIPDDTQGATRGRRVAHYA